MRSSPAVPVVSCAGCGAEVPADRGYAVPAGGGGHRYYCVARCAELAREHPRAQAAQVVLADQARAAEPREPRRLRFAREAAEVAAARWRHAIEGYRLGRMSLREALLAARRLREARTELAQLEARAHTTAPAEHRAGVAPGAGSGRSVRTAAAPGLHANGDGRRPT
jgi:hypothetical protein